MKIFFALSFLLLQTARAQDLDCGNIDDLKLKMDAHASNIVRSRYHNPKVEKTFISSYAKSLLVASKTCPEKVKVTDRYDGSAIELTYKDGDIHSDTVNFGKKGEIVSWTRKDKKSNAKVVNF